MEGQNNKLNSCKSLENFRMRTRKQMTFRQALSNINSIIRDKIKNLSCVRELNDDVAIHNIGADCEFVSCITEETCRSPKQNILNRLKSDNTLDIDITDRFKCCEGKPIFRVSDVDKSTDGLRERQRCIVCKKRTNGQTAPLNFVRRSDFF